MGSVASQAVQLFDLSTDPGEAHDLSTAHDDVRERLQKSHDAWVEGMPAPYTRVSRERVLEFVKGKQAARAKASAPSK
jgi:hypothetical protein